MLYYIKYNVKTEIKLLKINEWTDKINTWTRGAYGEFIEHIRSIYIYKTLHVKITQKHQKQLFLSYKSLFIRQRFSATYNTEYFRVFTLWIPPRHKERKNKQTKNQAPAGYSQTIVVGLSKKSRKGDHNL